MEITSVAFLLFLAVNLVVYWKLPRTGQWILLLMDSVLFFFLNAVPYTAVYVLCSILSVYGATMFFQKCDDQKKNRTVLVLTMVLNVGILAVLKYSNFGIHTVNIISKWIGKPISAADVTWIAPLAISFYTLQLVSYLLDCYWGIAKAYANPFRLALYTIYFPLMISGPICRYSDIDSKLFEKHEFDYDRVVCGLRRIAWGMVKKLAISNRLAIIVDFMYQDTVTMTGGWVWIATLVFLLQLYADFSGCMDIVLGASGCFGIELPENFNAPFFSTTTQEFWRRWHITLGTWLRDYIMNPVLRTSFCIRLGDLSKKKLGKKKGKKVPVYFAMLILWLCMGLWHGNSWKYVAGEGLWLWLVIVLGQIFETPLGKIKEKLRISEHVIWRSFQRLRTIFILMISMVFFRADSFMTALHLLAGSFSKFIKGFTPAHVLAVRNKFLARDIVSDIGGKGGIFVFALSIIALVVVDYCKYREVNVQERISRANMVVRWALYFMVVFIILLSFSVTNAHFAYAQF